MSTKTRLLAAATTMVSTSAMAHPGDHSTGSLMSLIWHQITEPDHLLLAVLVAAVVGYGIRMLRKRKA